MNLVVHRCAAEAGEFHARELGANEAWFVSTSREAVVLGSRQDDSLLDLGRCSRDGVEVTTRRSGGGIVHLVPGEHVWVDVTISDDHPRWTADVVDSSAWIGEAWVRALADLGIGSLVHRGRLSGDPLGELVCFASLGPGEVTDPSGAKLVGISQRRTRSLARFQCTVLTRWSPQRLLELLSPDRRAMLAADSAAELGRRVAVVDRPIADIESAFERALLAH